MDIDEEVVETSDAEELAELEAARRNKSPIPLTEQDFNRPLLPHSPPRKKVKLHHEFDRLSVSPAKSALVTTSTPSRSQSSSTMLGTTPPAHPFSRSSTQTPSSIHSAPLIKLEDDHPPPIPCPAPADLYPQDPLLLEAPGVPTLSTPSSSPDLPDIDMADPFLDNPSNRGTTTPLSSPPGPRVRFQSVDPLDLFGTSPPPSPSFQSLVAMPEGPQEEFGKDALDDLLVFTPVKEEASPVAKSSPLSSHRSFRSQTPSSPASPTPSEGRRRSTSEPLGRSPSPGPQSSQSAAGAIDHEAQEEADRQMAEAVDQEEGAGGRRYSLRHRNAAQIRPYAYDRKLYERVLKNNPDAIVKDKILDRPRHNHPEDRYVDEETILDNEEERLETELARRIRREEKGKGRADPQQSTSGPEVDPVSLPEILQEELSSSDEEQAKEIQRLSKEGRRLLKEQERRRKAEEKEEQRRQRDEAARRAKRFPVSRPTSGSPGPSTSAHRSRQRSLSSERGDDDIMILDERPNSGLKATDPQASRATFDEHDFLRDYFAGDDDFGTHSQSSSTFDSGQATSSRQPSVAPSGSADLYSFVDPERLRILRKMWPETMVIEYLESLKKAANEKKKKRALQAVKANSDSGPLRPGQSRVRQASRPRDSSEIRKLADPESDVDNNTDLEDDNSHSNVALPPSSADEGESSDVDDILTTYGRAPPRAPSPDIQVIDVDALEDADSETEDIQFVNLQRIQNKGAATRFREPSMIDYMLAGPSTFKASKDKSSRFRLDIMTKDARGFGRGRQTLLSFKNHGKGKEKDSRPKAQKEARRPKPNGPVPSSSNSRARLEERQAEKDSRRKQLSWKAKKKKERIKLQKKMGVWTKQSDGRIERKTAFVTLDLEDEGLHQALAPSSRSIPPRKATRQILPGRANVLDVSVRSGEDEPTAPHPVVVAEGERRRRLEDIPTDFGLDLPHSGKAFAADSYIRQGWLHHLTKIHNLQSVQPTSVTMFGINLECTVSVEDFSSTLSRICNAFYDFATSLPGPDDEKFCWDLSKPIHLLSQALSWYLQHGTDQEREFLRTSIESEVNQLVGKIRALTLDALEMPILSICWFLIELSATASPYPIALSPDGRPTGLLNEVIPLLTSFLLRCDLKQVMRPFEHDPQPRDSLHADFVAELWVRLIHLSGYCSPVDGAFKPKNHPFWIILMDALDLRMQFVDTMSSSFETSELIWHTIWAMCTLAHFSVFGMTVKQSSLPACWDIVVFALKRIRLTQLPQESCLTTKGAMIACAVDRYVALLVQRCFLMRYRWGWSLTNAVTMFNHTVEIFRSRKFANLLHEPDDYPKFFLEQNWDLLSVYDDQDIAYIMFLKLVHQAILEDPQYKEGQLPPKVKKLISMAVPMSSLPFSKTNPPPKISDLAMYYNRIAALAIVGDLEKGDCRERISAARRYISFSTADNDSRLAAMRGMSYWARLMVSRGVSLEAMGEWIAEMAIVIKSEFTAASQKANKSAIDDALLLVESLLNQVRKIFESCAKKLRYPDAVLISSLREILRPESKIMQEARLYEEFGRFARALFDARLKALPPAPRPLPPPSSSVIEEDSQDYGDMGNFDNVDWSAVGIAALAEPTGVNAALEGESIDVKESKLRSALLSVDFRRIGYNFMQPYIKPPGPGVVYSKHASECDGWIHLYLCCACVEAPPSDWEKKHLGTLDTFLEGLREKHPEEERWVRRVELSIMFQMLSLQPTLAFEDFLNALTSDYVTNREGKPRTNVIERQYVAHMLSIDNSNHPLLSDIDGLLPPRNPESGDYEISPEVFLGLRVPLLDAIFKNLDSLIQRKREGHPNISLDTDKYVQLCRAMLSAMRFNLSQCDKASPKYAADTNFCLEVVNTISKYPELSNRHELKFFVQSWNNALNTR
ncbi:hypothetical protein CVT26_000370 [Gymnopilus dilepis]|uniref:Protein mms22 n=1 Tax=Gymnopilus dilepis TaxID=231916 RepID=A0A409VHN5_9AGAR|nr:hypothetical protein CVT26_000370 [Gymnopilus dilepis]